MLFVWVDVLEFIFLEYFPLNNYLMLWGIFSSAAKCLKNIKEVAYFVLSSILSYEILFYIKSRGLGCYAHHHANHPLHQSFHFPLIFTFSFPLSLLLPLPFHFPLDLPFHFPFCLPWFSPVSSYNTSSAEFSPTIIISSSESSKFTFHKHLQFLGNSQVPHILPGCNQVLHILPGCNQVSHPLPDWS